MSLSKVKITRALAENFEVVAAHYGLKECGEYEEAKQLVREHVADAERSYAVMAKEIKT